MNWTTDAVNGCAEMRKRRAAEPDKRHRIDCDRLTRRVADVLNKRE
jgi:hypothetical protein